MKQQLVGADMLHLLGSAHSVFAHESYRMRLIDTIDRYVGARSVVVEPFSQYVFEVVVPGTNVRFLVSNCGDFACGLAV